MTRSELQKEVIRLRRERNLSNPQIVVEMQQLHSLGLTEGIVSGILYRWKNGTMKESNEEFKPLTRFQPKPKRPPGTPSRRGEVLALGLAKKTPKEIAKEMGIDRGTARSYLASLRKEGHDIPSHAPIPSNEINKTKSHHALVDRTVVLDQNPLGRILSWKPTPPRVVPDDVPRPRTRFNVDIMGLTNTKCKYIVSEDQAPIAMYCGNKVERKVYCEYHAVLCYQPNAPRKKRIA